MGWSIIRTDRFSEEFKKFEKNVEFVNALDKKIKRLERIHMLGVSWQETFMAISHLDY
jgi:hypothetical protein